MPLSSLTWSVSEQSAASSQEQQQQQRRRRQPAAADTLSTACHPPTHQPTNQPINQPINTMDKVKEQVHCTRRGKHIEVHVH
jgi:hypothetical protein